MALSPATRAEPRITVNHLAQFMVSSDTARVGIITRAKTPSTPTLIRYKDVRPVVCSFLADQNRSTRILAEAEQLFNQRAADPALSSLRQDDANNSIEVVRSLHRMANQLAQFSFEPAPRRQNPLVIAGVTISARADLISGGASRGARRSGAAILRLTQDDADTDAARERRREMGLYVATIAALHADQNLTLESDLDNRLCMSIDVQHREVFRAPASNTRRMNNIESACRFIASMWDAL